MKGLLLKDIYNIGHNAKQMLLLMIFMAICVIPSSNAYGYIVTSSIIFCIMLVTTFSMDERSGFLKYAMVMPLTPKIYVLEKYILNIIFSVLGTFFGVIVALTVTMISGTFSKEAFVGCSLGGLSAALLFGSLYIAVLFRFGAEQSRFIIIGVALVPSLLVFLLLKIIGALQITITSQHIRFLLAAAPVILLLIMAATYYYSLHCLLKKEF